MHAAVFSEDAESTFLKEQSAQGRHPPKRGWELVAPTRRAVNALTDPRLEQRDGELSESEAPPELLGLLPPVDGDTIDASPLAGRVVLLSGDRRIA